MSLRVIGTSQLTHTQVADILWVAVSRHFHTDCIEVMLQTAGHEDLMKFTQLDQSTHSAQAADRHSHRMDGISNTPIPHLTPCYVWMCGKYQNKLQDVE